MKTTLKYFLLILISFSFSCKESNKNISKSTDQILNSSEKDLRSARISATSLDVPTKSEYGLHSPLGFEEIKVDSNGFDVGFDVNGPAIVELRLGYNNRLPIFVSPQNDIQLEYNENDLLNNFFKVKFIGANKRENKTLLELKKILKFKNTNNNPFYNCSEETFIERIDSLENMANKVIKKYKLNNKQPKSDFLKLAQSYINSELAYYLEDYPRKLEYSFGKKYASLNDQHHTTNSTTTNKTDDLINLSQLYLSKNESYRVHNSEFLNNTSYANYLFQTVSINSYDIFYTDDYDQKGRAFPDLNLHLQTIDSLFSQKELADYLKFRFLLSEIKLTDENIELFIESFKETNPPNSYIEILERKLKATPKKEIGNYVFKDLNGKETTLSEFKGKIVYVDVWATWCPPCMEEKPHFKKLINSFGEDNKDIEFVAISVDTDVDKWKKLVKKENLIGKQLNLNEGIKHDFRQDYLIWGIPRYMILDRNGKMIKTAAQRPSNKNLLGYLQGLIESNEEI